MDECLWASVVMILVFERKELNPAGGGQSITGHAFFHFSGAVGGGRSHCIAVETVYWFAVNLVFALQGLAHFYCLYLSP